MRKTYSCCALFAFLWLVARPRPDRPAGLYHLRIADAGRHTRQTLRLEKH